MKKLHRIQEVWNKLRKMQRNSKKFNEIHENLGWVQNTSKWIKQKLIKKNANDWME